MTSKGLTPVPQWWLKFLGVDETSDGTEVRIGGRTLVWRAGVLREYDRVSGPQEQTREVFAYKWQKRHTFESPQMLQSMRLWLDARYGSVSADGWLSQHGDKPLLLDAGCGAAMSALELFRTVVPNVRYLGADISEAVDVAKSRFSDRGLREAVFLQCDIMRLPLPPESVDIIFSEGVLHHTDSTEHAIRRLAMHLKPGGRLLFYVYRRKGPVREFTDDYVRARLRSLPPDQGWQAMVPLTKLGKALGEINIEIDIPEPIDLLEIPAGRISLQRFFYWHVCKAFYRPDLTLDEMNHINFDWYAPANAHRQTPDQVRSWCDEAKLEIEREIVEEAGITIIARRSTAR